MNETQTYWPFDNWLYLKIYTGFSTADQILTGILYPAWLKARSSEDAEKWFFIRFADPDFHIRYRIKFHDPERVNLFMRELKKKLKPYTDSGMVWNMEVSAYFPEKERYGNNSMQWVEDIFSADSEAFVNFLVQHKNDKDLRWLFSVLSIDRMLNDFKYSMEARKDLMLGLSRSFGDEFGKNRDLARQLSSKYREHRQKIYDYLGNDDQAVFQNRSKAVVTAVEQIMILYDRGQMEVEMNDLLTSLIHMSMNRIFQTNNRMHEMVIYDFLFRHYKSRQYDMRNSRPDTRNSKPASR